MENDTKRQRGWRYLPWLIAMVAGLLMVTVVSASLPGAVPGSAPPNGPTVQQSEKGKTAAQSEQQIVTSSGESSGISAPPPAPASPNVILYDQYDNPAVGAGSNITSQDFETANDPFDSFAADDFVVPGGQTWNVNGVDVDGVYQGSGPAASVNVYFYSNSGTLPGALVATRLAQTYAPGPAAGDFVVTISPDVVLAPGTYWVSVQARQDFTPAGQWFWNNRTVQSNNPSAWQNPGGGFGTTCSTWGVKTVCIPTQVGPDQVFRLNGTLGGGATPTPIACNIVDFASTDVPKTISPTGVNTVTSVLTVPQSLILAKVEVTNLNISHTFASDLDVFLISPTGTRIELFTDVCGTQVWTVATTGFNLNQGATNLIGTACPPMQATYRPEGNLNTFNGENAQGVWTLQIVDDANLDGGSLNSWGLRLTSGAGCPSKTVGPLFTATRTNTPTNTRTVTQTRTPTVGATNTAVAGTPTCPPGGGVTRALIAYADQAGPPTTLITALQAEGITTVDLFDAFVATPPLALLNTYPMVIAFSNNTYFDATAMGNVLADYADAGGIVVSLNFNWYGPPFGLEGRWMTGGYSPYNSPAPTLFSTSNANITDPTHPLMLNVTTLTAFFRHSVTLSTGAVSVAAWQDGPSAVAYKTNAGRTGVGINAYLGQNPQNYSGQFGRVIANAGRWLAGGGGCPTPSVVVPTTTRTVTRTNTVAVPTATATGTVCVTYNVITTTGTIVSGTVNTGNACDDCSTNIVLPFSYVLYSTTYTNANVISNGSLQFTTTNTAFTNACLPAAGFGPTIFPHWDDLRTDANPGCAGFPGGLCGIFTSVSGSAPNRIFNIEWRAVYFATPANPVNFEVRLYEGLTQFDLVYGAGVSGASSTVGVQAGATGPFTQYVCNGVGGTLSNGLLLRFVAAGGPCPTNTVLPTVTATRTNTSVVTPTCPPGGAGGLLIGSGITMGYGPNNYTVLASNHVSYTFANSVPAANQYAIFQTHDPWGATIVKNAITAAGRTFTVFTPAQLAGFNFSQYRVVILNWDDHNLGDFLGPYTAAIPALQTYIQNGGVVWVQGSIQGSAGDNYPMPFGGLANHDFHATNDVVANAHPLVAGVPDPFTGNFASHAEMTGLPAGATTIVVSGASAAGSNDNKNNSANGKQREAGLDTPNLPTLYEYRPGGAGGCPTPSVTRTVTRTNTPPVGTPTCPPGGPIVINGSLTAADPDQVGRLFRDGVASTCALPGPCALNAGDTAPRNYDAYTFTNTSGSSVCVTINLDAQTCIGTQFLFSAAYLGSFNPASLCTNYLGDGGSSPNPVGSYDVTVPAGATFVVVVHEVTSAALCPAYTLTITGLPGGGGCPTPGTVVPTVTRTNTPPVVATPTCPPGGGTPGPWTVVAPRTGLDVYGPGGTGDATYFYSGSGYSFSTSGYTNTFARYNPATNTWSALANIPSPGEEIEFVYSPLNNKVYAFGGIDAVSIGTAYNLTRIYDVTTNTWSAGAVMPAGRQQMGGAYHNGKIYLAGGYADGFISTASSTLYIYDVATNTFTTGAPVPQVLGGPGSGVINGRFYLAGGRTNPDAILNTLYEYDPVANSWATRAPLLEARNVPGSSVIGNKLWIYGGGNPFFGQQTGPVSKNGPSLGGEAPQTTNLTRIYDPVANAWVAGPNLNQQRSFNAGGTVGTQYVVTSGGYTGSTSTTSTEVSTVTGGGGCPTPSLTPIVPTVTRTNTVGVGTATPTCPPGGTGSWRIEPSMITGRGGAGAAVVNNQLYIVAGFNAAPNYVGPSERFDPATNTWVARAAIPTPHAQSEAAAVGTNIYVPGGFNSVQFTGPLTSMQIYNTLTDSWSQGAAMPAARSGVGAAAFNGKVYVIAGFAAGFVPNNTVYEYDPVLNTYTTKAPMPVSAGNLTAAVLGNEIIAVGGVSGFGSVASHAYNPATDTWRALAPFPTTSFQSPAAFALNGELWAVGGTEQTLATQVQIYNPGSNSWRVGPLFNLEHRGPSAAYIPLNGRGYVAGGGPSGQYTAVVESIGGAGGCPTPSVVPPTVTRTNTVVVPPTNTNTVVVPPTSTRTNTVVVPPTNTVVVPPTNTVVVPPTNTVVVPPTSTRTNTSVPTVTRTNTPVPPTNTPVTCIIRFTDVPVGAPFYDEIRCLVCRDIVDGYACGGTNPETGSPEPCEPGNWAYFRPNNRVIRGQIAKMVSNSSGDFTPAGAQRYADVPPSNTFYAFINRLTARGVMGGYPCGGTNPQGGGAEPCNAQNQPYFRPYNWATRGQIAQITARGANINDPVPAGTHNFTDVPPGSTFYVPVERLRARGVMTGVPCGGVNPQTGQAEPCDAQNRAYFRVNNYATRGQTAQIVSRTFFPGCITPNR